MRGLAIAALITQAGIAVTGSVVRVTGSGLGCPTWPECFPGSLVPMPHPEIGPLHQWVEFGNRLLTVLVIAVAGACLLAAWWVRPRRRRLVWLAAAMPLGVLAQAVVGRGERARRAGLVDGGAAPAGVDGAGLARGAAGAGHRRRPRAAAADRRPAGTPAGRGVGRRARRGPGRGHPGHRGRPARRRRRDAPAGGRGGERGAAARDPAGRIPRAAGRPRVRAGRDRGAAVRLAAVLAAGRGGARAGGAGRAAIRDSGFPRCWCRCTCSVPPW